MQPRTHLQQVVLSVVDTPLLCGYTCSARHTFSALHFSLRSTIFFVIQRQDFHCNQPLIPQKPYVGVLLGLKKKQILFITLC